MTSQVPVDLDLWIQELSAFFRSPIKTLGSRWFDIGLTTSKWAIRALIAVLALAVCLFSAFLIFTWIYFTMMPVKHVEKQAYFDFSKDSPEALVSLVGNQWQYKTPSPYNLQPIMTFLTSGVPYDVDVEFTVANQVASSQSGMLMIEATAEHAYRDQVQTVAHSKRPIELKKVPAFIQLIRDSFMLVPMLVGLYSPSFRVKTRVFERFVDYQQFPISTMNLTLIRAPTHHGEVHFTNASLTFTLHLSGWRFLFYNYFWTSAFILIPLLALILFLLALTGYFTMITKPTTTKRPAVEEEETTIESVPTSRSPSPSPRSDEKLTSSESAINGITRHSSRDGNVEHDDDDDDEVVVEDGKTVNAGGSHTVEPFPVDSITRSIEDNDEGSDLSALSEDDARSSEHDRIDGRTMSDFEPILNEFEDDITVSSSSGNDGKVDVHQNNN